MPSQDVRVDVRLSGGRAVSGLSQRLRRAGNVELQATLRARIRDAASPVAQALRRAAMSLPESSPARRRDGTSLRRAIANAITVQETATGVRIYVDRNRMPADARGLGAAIENPRGWRHPVFGRPEMSRSQWTWVQQSGHPWFGPTVRLHDQEFQKALADAVDDIRRQIGGR